MHQNATQTLPKTRLLSVPLILLIGLFNLLWHPATAQNPCAPQVTVPEPCNTGIELVAGTINRLAVNGNNRVCVSGTATISNLVLNGSPAILDVGPGSKLNVANLTINGQQGIIVVREGAEVHFTNNSYTLGSDFALVNYGAVSFINLTVNRCGRFFNGIDARFKVSGELRLFCNDFVLNGATVETGTLTVAGGGGFRLCNNARVIADRFVDNDQLESFVVSEGRACLSVRNQVGSFNQPVTGSSSLLICLAPGISEAAGTLFGAGNVSRDCTTCDELLPATFRSISGIRQGKQVILTWETLTESNVKDFIAESSTNGVTFTQAGPAVPARGTASTYRQTLMPGQPEASWFRLRITDLDGSIRYSRTLHLPAADITALRVYPNPARQKINVQLPAGFSRGNQALTLVNPSGQTVRQWPLPANGNAATALTLDLPNLPTGLYFLRYNLPGGGTGQQRLLIER